MRKIILASLLIVSLLFCCEAFAQQAKVIKLKDGSTVSGIVTSMQNGIYTIESPDLGILDIPEDKVLSISVANNSPAHTQTTATAGKDAMLNTQAQMMSNPALMAEVQELLKDPEIVNLLSDENLIDSVMKFDQESMQQNENFQKLIQHPAMKQLIEKQTQMMMQGNP